MQFDYSCVINLRVGAFISISSEEYGFFLFYHNNCDGHVPLNVKEFKIIREERSIHASSSLRVFLPKQSVFSPYQVLDTWTHCRHDVCLAVTYSASPEL